MNNQKQLIVTILDRSGSMAPFKLDSEGGFNTLIADQLKDTSLQTQVTLIQFNERYEEVYHLRPISDVPPLNLIAMGNTALNDAVGKTVVTVGQQLADLKESDRPGKVYLVIITDGQENASTEFAGETGRQRIRQMIEHQRNQYNWQVLFIGADLNTMQVAKDYGIPAGSTAVMDVANTAAVYSTVSSTITRSNASRGPAEFTEADRKALVDRSQQPTMAGSGFGNGQQQINQQNNQQQNNQQRNNPSNQPQSGGKN